MSSIPALLRPQPVRGNKLSLASDEQAKSKFRATRTNAFTINFIDFLEQHKSSILSIANYGQATANAVSFLSQIPALKPLANLGQKTGELGTKIFFLINGAINAAQQFRYKNLTSAIGYLVYVFNGLFVPQKHTYMMNGLGVALTQWSNQVNNIMKVSRSFPSIGAHFSNFIQGSCKIIEQSWRNPIRAIIEGKPILGLSGAFLSLLGFGYWLITGDDKIGALIRDTGGGVVDAEQLLPHQWHFKRFNYIKSGFAYLAGTLFDLGSKFIPNYSQYLRPLSFLWDGFGRYFQGLSEQNNEMGLGHLSPSEAKSLSMMDVASKQRLGARP